MKRTFVKRCAMAGFFAVAAPSISAVAQDAITPVPMPNTLGFPVPGYVIEQWVERVDRQAIRGHGYDIWNSMSQPTDQPVPGQTGIRREKMLPVWDTWQSDLQLFPHPASSGTDTPYVHHPYRYAHQHLHSTQDEITATKLSSDDVAISFNKFDPVAAQFILQKQLAQNGKEYHVNTAAGLEAINAAWDSGTPVSQRAIHDFPYGAIETKPVFTLVRKSGLTPLPMWQGVEHASNQKNPTPSTWDTCVLVDPSPNNVVQSLLKQGGSVLVPAQTAVDNQYTTHTAVTAAEELSPALGNSCSTFMYAPMSMFYTVPLDESGAAAFKALQNYDYPVQVGDFAALVAMHVNTKELSRWTWQTFYWQGNSAYDVQFPGNLFTQPASLASPWTSYAMCTAYDQVIGGEQVICFNPWLETSPGIPDGINSNCVSCHGMAAVGSGGTTASYPPSYTSSDFPIPIQFDDPVLFGRMTKTDFSWALADSGSGITLPKTQSGAGGGSTYGSGSDTSYD